MAEKAANRKAAVRAPLPVLKRNAAADPRKMRRIIAEDSSWSLAIVPPLSDLCLQHIVHNFHSRPLLEELQPIDKGKVLASLPSALPLPVSAALISCEEYWRRRGGERWPISDVSRHGGSWKRLFFERHLQNLIERFIPGLTDPRPICEAAELCRDYVRRLDLQQLLPPVRLESRREDGGDETSDAGSEAGGDLPSIDHFDFNLIAGSLCALEELRLVYGVKGCGMNFECNLFRFTERNCSLLADTFSTFQNLKVFRLLKSKVDDEKARVLLRSLLDHPSLVHLDLSHNLMAERGARAVAKLLNRSRLQILNLCNNQLRPRGAQAIAHALSNNSTLHTLNLRLNSLGDEGGRALCNALLHNGHLRTLHLGGNQLGAPTAAAMAHTLTRNTSLRSLSLASNPIGPDGGKELLEGMAENRTLLELDLRLTQVGPESDFLIGQILRGTRAPP